MLQKTLFRETREMWLLKMTLRYVKPYFKRHCIVLPKVRVSIGVPYARNPYKVVGQCFDAKASEDKVPCIFLSPTENDPVKVTSTLVHELIHAVLGAKEGHGKKFKEAALKLGFEPPMRETPMGLELEKHVKYWVKKLGKFPHAKLNFSDRKKQGTRMVKMTCVEDEYTVRAAKTPIVLYGAVICPKCFAPMKISTPLDE